jgi:hypothetical protein
VLSADPIVQFPSYAQSFNRYSYVLNNPLAYTDPSGFLAERVCFLASCGAAGSARVGAIGGPTHRPQIGIAVTRRGRLGSWATASLNEIGRILAANTPPPQGYGGTGTCPARMCWDHGEPRPQGRGFDFNGWMSAMFNWWMSAMPPPAPVVTYTPYAGLIAEGEGVSSGGAIATSTIAMYEQRHVGMLDRPQGHQGTTTFPVVKPAVVAPFDPRSQPGWEVLPPGYTGRGVPADVRKMIVGVVPALDKAFDVVDFKAADPRVLQEEANRLGTEVGNLSAYAYGTTIYIPPGKGVGIGTLTHEITHVLQEITVPNFAAVYEEATRAAYRRGATTPGDAYTFNRYEREASINARAVREAYPTRPPGP